MTRPLPIVAETMKPYAASPCAAYSKAYFALPVTFRGPSTRSSGRPIGPARSLCAMGDLLMRAVPRASAWRGGFGGEAGVWKRWGHNRGRFGALQFRAA